MNKNIIDKNNSLILLFLINFIFFNVIDKMSSKRTYAYCSPLFIQSTILILFLLLLDTQYIITIF